MAARPGGTPPYCGKLGASPSETPFSTSHARTSPLSLLLSKSQPCAADTRIGGLFSRDRSRMSDTMDTRWRRSSFIDLQFAEKTYMIPLSVPTSGLSPTVGQTRPDSKNPAATFITPSPPTASHWPSGDRAMELIAPWVPGLIGTRK